MILLVLHDVSPQQNVLTNEIEIKTKKITMVHYCTSRFTSNNTQAVTSLFQVCVVV